MSPLTTADLITTPSTLTFVAGYLAGCIDRRFNTGTAWTIKVYMDAHSGKLTLDYIYRLEQVLVKIWPEGESQPRVQDILRGGLTR